MATPSLDMPTPDVPNLDRPTCDTPTRNRSSEPYDIPTAVTFLIMGLGIGYALTLLFAPRFDRYSLLPSGASPHAAR
jgi:hypothetical protein